MKQKIISLVLITISLLVLGCGSSKQIQKINDNLSSLKGRKGITHINSNEVRYCENGEAEKLNKQGVKYGQQNKLKLARETLLKAMEIEGDHEVLFNNIGLVEFLDENYELASYYMFKAIEIDSSYIQPYLNLVVIYDNDEKYKKALEIGEVLSENLDDKNYSSLNYLNMIYPYIELKKCNKAREVLHTAKKLVGEKISALRNDIKSIERDVKKCTN
jgi:tetratricopeptide (TPR) repeat protein